MSDIILETTKNLFIVTPFQVGLLLVAALLAWWAYYEYKQYQKYHEEN